MMMHLLGFNITRAGAAKAVAEVSTTKALAPVTDRRGWLRIFESFAGAWQKGVAVDRDAVLAFHALYSCITLVAADIAKLRLKLVQKDGNGIWQETTNPAYSPVLRKPNTLQNRIQFYDNWLTSILTHGNCYVLKVRDNRRVVVRMYILDPRRVTVLISDSGEVFYKLSADNIAGLTEDVTVPASEIMHDRMNCLFHPLVGTSPLFAAGVAATQGLRIQNHSAWFFGNRAQPGGILAAPGEISDDTAARLKTYWEENFTGEKAGRIAVVGDGLKYEALGINAHDSQLIEQLKWSAEVVCSVFHVPPYKIGLGAMPTYNNIQALNVEYYSQCLQIRIESIELALDEGLELAQDLGTEFDLDGLLRMDSGTQFTSLKEGIAGGILAPNEARRRLDLPPVEGGDDCYLQQQNFSLAALAKRDSSDDPFANARAPRRGLGDVGSPAE
jgi:HK97 family phage portal protein